VPEDVISRDEVVALLFNVSDVAESLKRTRPSSEVTMAKKKGKLTKADFERRRQMGINAERTRQLALKGQAELDARKQEQKSG
jgi:hypothetical protein